MDDRTKWIGGGLFALVSAGAAAWWFTRPETPRSTLILKDGAIEVRTYDELTVAQIERPGTREAAVEAGLRTLLDRLTSASVGWLAPLLSDAQDTGWRTRVILAGDEKADDIDTLPARRVATIRIAGRTDDASIARHEAKLREWLEGYGLKATGPSELATYARSGTLSGLRRCEVWVPVESLY